MVAADASEVDCRNFLREIEEREDMHPTGFNDMLLEPYAGVYAEYDRIAG
jgi:hypothetical protein